MNKSPGICCRKNLGRRGMIWTGSLNFIVPYWRLCVLPPIEIWTGRNEHERLCFLGDLYFQFCFFCCHQPGWFTDHRHFRLANVKWATPLTRIAEIIAVSAIVFASLIIIVDMGRPERFMNLFLHGRIQSPIMWDVIVIGTYFFISLLLLYFPLLPDLKISDQCQRKNRESAE